MKGPQPAPPGRRAGASPRALAALALAALSLLGSADAQDSKPRPFAVLELRSEADLFAMVVVPAGSFVMGSDSQNDEKPPHRVYLRSFLLGKTEVTQAQWVAIMGSNPSRYSACGTDCPVDNVSWDDAQEFIRTLNQKTNQSYRLPSEAEWEYAARAGSSSEWSHGNDEARLQPYAWYSANSAGKTQAVGKKLPNAFGLFDMHGNVREWVQDCRHENYTGAPTDGSAWTTGCRDNYRVLRGGSWDSYPADLRSAIRYWYTPDNRYINLGLRLARTLLSP